MESSHVVWMGRAGWTDWQLKEFILQGDWTFVTINSVDFRGPQATRGTSGQYADVELHAGLICFNGPDFIDRDTQYKMLDAALQTIAAEGGDLINKLVEVTINEDFEIKVEMYSLPSEDE